MQKKKKMSDEQLENAKRAVFVDSLYEDITPENSPQHLIDYEPISDEEDWLSINSEMERELLTSSNREKWTQWWTRYWSVRAQSQ